MGEASPVSPLSWEVIIGLMASLGALGGVIVSAAAARSNHGRVVAEVQQIQHTIARDDTAALARQVLAEMQPNHGSSIRDQLTRVEHGLSEVVADIGGLRSELRGIHAEQARLASVDQDDRRHSRNVHAEFERRIQHLEQGDHHA